MKLAINMGILAAGLAMGMLATGANGIKAAACGRDRRWQPGYDMNRDLDSFYRGLVKDLEKQGRKNNLKRIQREAFIGR